MDKTYNGWKNYETWNVALWIGNDEGLYHLARESKAYRTFRKAMKNLGRAKTGDGVSYFSPKLDIPDLDEMIRELGA